MNFKNKKKVLAITTLCVLLTTSMFLFLNYNLNTAKPISNYAAYYLLDKMRNPAKLGVDSKRFDRQSMSYLIACGTDLNMSPTDSQRKSYCDNLSDSIYEEIKINPAAYPQWDVFHKLSPNSNEYQFYQNYMKTSYAVQLKTAAGRLWVAKNFFFHLPSDVIMQYKVGQMTGCTGMAKVYNHLLKGYNFKTVYLYTVKWDNYKEKCPVKGLARKEGNMDGHQVAAVLSTDGYWRIVNSTSGNWEEKLPEFGRTGAEASSAILKSNNLSGLLKKNVYFGDREDTHFVVGYTSDANVYENETFDRLMNMYASGSPSSKKCSF